jgi:3',5'-cyclic AMP phosphodiesterase CpdA
MSIIVQLSDTHFGTELPQVMNAVKRSIAEIGPDVIIISGDITQRARPGQFKDAAEFLAALPAKVKFVIPGNHDIPLFNIPLRIFSPYSNYLKEFHMRKGIWQHGDTTFIGYDATSIWRHTRGKLLEAEIIENITRARGKMTPGGILIACVHQPLDVAWPQDAENILVNAAHTAQLFATHGVDLVMSGHVHVPIITTTAASFSGLQRHFILSGAGTAISRRTRPGAPNSFNIIETTSGESGNNISVTLMEYQADTDRFTQRSKKIFAQNGSGWRMI